MNSGLVDCPPGSRSDHSGRLAAAGSDLHGVAPIAARLPPSLPERTAGLAETRRLCPAGCTKLRVAGYARARRCMLAYSPALDAFLGALPAGPDCRFIHDVAVLPEARGRAPPQTVWRMPRPPRQRAAFRHSLVAAYGTACPWRCFGCVAVEGNDIAAQLAAYGPGWAMWCAARTRADPKVEPAAKSVRRLRGRPLFRRPR
jgi:hypothetical protein